MKQILLLEKHEVDRLVKGKTLVISTQAGEIAIQFDRGSSNGMGGHACLCGKVLMSKAGLTYHLKVNKGDKAHGIAKAGE